MAIRANIDTRFQRRAQRQRLFRQRIVPWLFLAPVTLLHLAVVIVPSLLGLYYSLTEWSGIGAPKFVGLANFRTLFLDDPVFILAFTHNFMWLAFFLTVPFALALLAAALLAQLRRHGLLFRTLIFVPYLLADVVVAFIWKTLFSPRIGLGAQLAAWGLGIPFLQHAFLGDPKTALWGAAVAANWPWWGFLMVLFLAAMQGVSPELYDAAKIDGANRRQEFLNVTLPGIRPTVMFMYLMSSIWSFTSFGMVWVLTQGGPGSSSELLVTYLYKRAFHYLEVGYGAAIGLTVSVLAGVLVALSVMMRRRGWEE